MAALGLSMLVSRETAAGGPAALELNDFDNGYEVLSAGPGPEMMQLLTEDSDHHDGSVLVGYVMRDSIAPVRLRVYGESQADLEGRITALRRAFHQWTYTLTETRADYTRVWRCKPSAVVEGDGGVWDAGLLGLHWQDVSLSVTRAPF